MKLRQLKRNAPVSDAFENELALEILKSNRLRITILICAFGIVLPLILTLAVFAFEDFQLIFRGKFKSFLVVVLGVLTLGVGCFIAERLAINRIIAGRRKAYPFMP